MYCTAHWGCFLQKEDFTRPSKFFVLHNSVLHSRCDAKSSEKLPYIIICISPQFEMENSLTGNLLGNEASFTPWLVVRKRTILTEKPPFIGEVSANFCG
jgi:hypothetical protein